MAVAVIETLQTGSAAETNIALDTGNFTPNPSVGDLLIGFYSILGETGATITLPAGWTLIRETTSADLTAVSSIAYKIADSSDATGQSLTWTKSGSNAVLRLAMCRITGHRAASLITASSSQSNAASTTVTTTTVTPTEPDSLILFLLIAAGNVTASGYALATSSPSFTENLENSGGSYLMAMAWGVRPEVTATGNGTATLSSSGANVGHLVVISPPLQDTFTETVTVTDLATHSMSSIITDTVTVTDDLDDSEGRVQNVDKNSTSFTNVTKS